MGILSKLFGTRELDVSGSINNEVEYSKKEVNLGNTVFEFVVEDIFTISGRGTVVTGLVQKGEVRVGDEVIISSNGIRTVVAGIEMFRKSLDIAMEGDNAGLILRNVDRKDVCRGDIIYK